MELTDKIKEWLQSDEKDLDQGAELALRVNRNKQLYNYITRKRDAEKLEYELKKILFARGFAPESYLPVADPAEKQESTKAGENECEVFNKGKRTDHDQLPGQVQAEYDRAMIIYPQIRNRHTQMKMTKTSEERQPIREELTRLEDALNSAWEVYDSYDLNNPPVEQQNEIDSKRIQANRRYISDQRKSGWKNIDKKREEIQKRISEVYEVGEKFSDETVKELTDLGFVCTK